MRNFIDYEEENCIGVEEFQRRIGKENTGIIGMQITNNEELNGNDKVIYRYLMIMADGFYLKILELGFKVEGAEDFYLKV